MKPLIPEDELPDFKAPPVTEVVLSVAFEPLAKFDSLLQAELWGSHFRDQFPHAQEQPPYLPPVEMFGDAGRQPQVAIQFGSGALPPRRLWFLDAPGNRLIQLQQDWFAINWRRVTGTEEYPHYPELRDLFVSSFERFLSFASEHDLGPISPTQCEVTYINHIDRRGIWTDHGEADKVLNRLTREDGRILAQPEDAQIAMRFLMVDEPGADANGRLHVAFQPAFRTEGGEPIFMLSLTARGAPLTPDIEGVLAFLDLGRMWIVQGFADVTEKEMHRVWGRFR